MGNQRGLDPLSKICTEERNVNLKTLKQTILLAIEIAREGREGKKVGTMFVISDTKKVMQNSRSMILDPLAYHPNSQKHIDDPNMRETVKELAQLDGAFIVSDDGVILSGCQYINASSNGIDLPLGLGSRHMAAASITRKTEAVAVVVSESGVVRIFDNGEMISEIIPELWLIKRYSENLKTPYSSGDLEQVSEDD